MRGVGFRDYCPKYAQEEVVIPCFRVVLWRLQISFTFSQESTRTPRSFRPLHRSGVQGKCEDRVVFSFFCPAPEAPLVSFPGPCVPQVSLHYGLWLSLRGMHVPRHASFHRTTSSCLAPKGLEQNLLQVPLSSRARTSRTARRFAWVFVGSAARHGS